MSASAELPADGWSFDYISIEGSRLGRDVFRPAVPIRIGSTEFSPRVALVDSGSEHTLAPRWIADQARINLDGSPTLELGIGGRVAVATFADVELHLHREHDGNEHVSWTTTVGFVEPWDARFAIVLGQIGFFDEFTVSMNRNLLIVRLSHHEELLPHITRLAP